ncbi:MAG: hypothetical protein WBM56_13915, partial [Robiginitalea sp.]|uniref:hypothetical protein n=1 Tax=Robiginitalea sp. TaxID=1902411 RepID=UPI003C756ADD
GCSIVLRSQGCLQNPGSHKGLQRCLEVTRLFFSNRSRSSDSPAREVQAGVQEIKGCGKKLGKVYSLPFI